MTTDPRECIHDLACDTTTHIVYCTRCMWWWDADFETPNNDTRVSFDHGDENDTWENHPEWQEDGTRVLNADNEPTSEHMQYTEDNRNDN